VLKHNRTRCPRRWDSLVGNPNHENEHDSSITLAEVQRTFASDNVQLFSMQKRTLVGGLTTLSHRANVTDLTSQLNNFPETAACSASSIS
jgi:hypothetical protein